MVWEDPLSVSSFTQDVRYALRILRQSPLFTAVAVSSLALGIGANTAIFTLTDAILLRWLPVQNPQELVVLARSPSKPNTSFNYPDYRFVRDQNRSYTGLMAFSGAGRPISFGLPGRAASQLVKLSMVSGNYFDVLGVRPALGRLFNPGDNETEGAQPYAILSHAFWKRTLGQDTSVVGRDVVLNGATFQVIGVSQEGFTGASVGIAPDVFVPIVMFRTFNPTATFWNTRNVWWLTVIGRLKPGVTHAGAGAEFNVLWQRILQEDPKRRPVAAWDKNYKNDNTAFVLPGSQGYSYLRNQTSKPLTILMITVCLVLLIACANIANLLLARGMARRREISVRLAVGAARGRLVLQMLTESVTLSMLGGVAGLAIAWIGVRILLSFLPGGAFPVELNLSPDFRLLSFTFGLSLLTGLTFGLAPAVSANRPDLVSALKSDTGSSDHHRLSRWDLRRTLVSIQVALSLLLLAGAALFVRTLTNLHALDPGMNRENLLLVETNIGQLGYQPQRERIFHDRLREDIQRLPGVRAAAMAAITPLSGSRWNNSVQIEGYQWKADEPPHIDMNAVTPRYFEAAGIPIVLGRDFRESDSLATLPERPAQPPAPGTDLPDPPASPPRVAIVNEAFARRFFGGQSAVGRRFSLGDKWNAAKTYEIVGVVRDARYFDLRKAVEPMIYQPAYRERGGAGATLCVRTTGEPNRLVQTIRGRVREIESAVSVTETRTMEENLNRNLMQERFVAMLGGFFGLVALLLAAVGLYGVMSQAVTTRTREIGIRMALGAQGKKVLWMILRDALVMVFVGAVIGLSAALVLTRYTESLLYGVKPIDPPTLLVTGLLLLALTTLAGFLPARRATRVEPMQALRHE
jgi:predicted permease